MPKGDRGAVFAVGLVVGVAIALFFFVWAFPWFRDPSQYADYQERWYQEAADQSQNQNDPHFWISPFYGWLYAEDTLAQWIMACFGAIATVISIWAVILLRDTLEANRRSAEAAVRASKAAEEAAAVSRQVGQAQVRAYLAGDGLSIRPVVTNLEDGKLSAIELRTIIKNVGQSPARELRYSGETFFYDPKSGPIEFNKNPEFHKSAPITIGSGVRVFANNKTISIDDILVAIANNHHIIVVSYYKFLDVFGQETNDFIAFRALPVKNFTSLVALSIDDIDTKPIFTPTYIR